MTEAYFAWASEHGRAGLKTPEELERQGWIRICRHNLWPSSWLMKYEIQTQNKEVSDGNKTTISQSDGPAQKVSNPET